MEVKIYIANLGKYNEGVLQGRWVTLPVDDFEEIFKSIGIDGVMYEEHAIHDYECSFMDIHEYDNLERLNEIAEKVEDFGIDEEAMLIALKNYGLKIEDAIDKVDDCSIIRVSDVEEFGRYMADELGDIPEHLTNYIDYEIYGQSFLDGGGYHELFDDGIEAVVHINE